jgi:small subunit ribosomal protein S1
LAHNRIDRVEDVLTVGEKITVRVLAIDPADKGPHPKLRLSVRALEAAPVKQTPEAGEILKGTVSKLSGAGVFVDTEKGTGLVPARELGIPRGADFRRIFPVGREVQVVMFNRDSGSGRLTFSISRVAGVEEEQNYTAFARAQSQSNAPASRDVGTFGELLRQKLSASTQAAPAKPQASSQGQASGKPLAPQTGGKPQAATHQPPVRRR